MYVKEYCTQYHKAVIRMGRNYSKSAVHIFRMVEILKEDFGISEVDVEIKMYAGSHYARTMGVEVTVPMNSPVPREYDSILGLEQTYG